MSKYPRASLGAAAIFVIAFVCGVLFASGFDLTKFGHAQQRGGGTSKLPAQDVAPLAETQNAFEAIVDKAKPAVVSIHVRKYADQTPTTTRGNGRRGGRQQIPPGQIPPGLEDLFKNFDFDVPDPSGPTEGAGSGFIVSKDGYILTNNHVVQGADTVVVTMVDKRSYGAKVIGRDPTTDVAVIKINANNLPFMALGNDATARVGQWVLAIGNPLELDFTVTAGIISAKGRSNTELAQRMGSYGITDFIQTDAAINPGNSGGPLVNIRGEVIGINSAIATGTGYYAGYGFAIPITLAKEVMDDLIKYGKVRRAMMGVSLNEVTPEDAEAAGLNQVSGALVRDFTDSASSPAARAGVRVGDVITSAAGQPVDKVATLQRIIRGFEPNETVEIEAIRYGEKKTFRIKLAEVPSTPTVADNSPLMNRRPNVEPTSSLSANKLGITVEPISQAFIQETKRSPAHRTGLLVTDINARGPAFQKLIPNGSVIEKVMYPKEIDIRTTSDLDRALAGVKSGQVVQLLVWEQQPGASTGAYRPVGIRVP